MNCAHSCLTSLVFLAVASFPALAQMEGFQFFGPPSTRRFWLRTADFWERLGRRLSSYYAGGVLLVEATKQVPPSLRPGLRTGERRPLRVLDGLPIPEPKPA